MLFQMFNIKFEQISIVNFLLEWCHFEKDVIGSFVRRHIGKPELVFGSNSFIHPMCIKYTFIFSSVEIKEPWKKTLYSCVT